MSRSRRIPLTGGLLVAATARAQRAPVSPVVRSYVRFDTTVLALTHVRVIDGTGAPAPDDQTLIVRDGRIVALWAAARDTRRAGYS